VRGVQSRECGCAERGLSRGRAKRIAYVTSAWHVDVRTVCECVCVNFHIWECGVSPVVGLCSRCVRVSFL